MEQRRFSPTMFPTPTEPRNSTGMFGDGAFTWGAAPPNRLREHLFDGEMQYFKGNPNVAGMAAEDGRVIMNPWSPLSETERGAVYRNELARLLMREKDVSPAFSVTPEQRATFAGTPYATNEAAMRETIAARLVSGDPSGKEATGDQRAFVNRLAALLADFK